MITDIRKNLSEIKEAIKAASGKANHPSAKLVAVSKGQPAWKVETALKAGHKVFGENRVQEAAEKWPEFQKSFPGIELHLIGPLQSNKVKTAVELFEVIQTLDRPKLARKLKKQMEATGKTPKLFIQVNTGEEPQKAGVTPNKLPEFFETCQKLGLEIEGLMAIPPIDEEPAMHFALLKKLGGRLGLKKFSMGMSADYETACALGATHVRVGTGVFGPREKKGQGRANP